MLKQISTLILALLFSYTTFATQPSDIRKNFEFITGLSNFKTQRVMHNHIDSNTNKNFPAAENNYADYSGDWIGKCKFDDNDDFIDGLYMPISIENDAHTIKLCYEGKCSELEIGKDLGEHQLIDNGFKDFHYAFSWVDKSSLVFSLTSLSIHEQDFVESALIRVIFSKEDDKLIMNSEYSYLLNTSDSKNDRFTCEFERN